VEVMEGELDDSTQFGMNLLLVWSISYGYKTSDTNKV